MSQEPEHYIPEYINTGNQRNPFAPSYGISRHAAVVVKQKSLFIAYLLWFFLGVFGGHKLYLRQPFMCLFYLILHGLGWLTAPILVGYVFFFILGLLMFIDLFTMPIRVGLMNSLATARVQRF